jgi:hypothetical protein
MQEITIRLKNTENIGYLKPEQIKNIQNILTALISSGGLTGVKGGKTIIHFDGLGNFRGVQLDYWPFVVRKS